MGADYITTNYRLIVPEFTSRDWGVRLSNDIITIDTILGYVSSDIAIISGDLDTITQDIAILSQETVFVAEDALRIIPNTGFGAYALSVDALSVDGPLMIAGNYIFPITAPTVDGMVISYDSITDGLVWGLTPSAQNLIAIQIISSDMNNYTGPLEIISTDVNAISNTVVIMSTDINAALAATFIQVVSLISSEVVTGTTIMPEDDTIPQITEGDQYMVLAITPTSATNLLRIDVVVFASHTVSQAMQVGLFQDATANAIASGQDDPTSHTQVLTNMGFTHWMTAGTVAATSFQVRIGGETGATTTFNGNLGAREMGGSIASGMTITEYKQ